MPSHPPNALERAASAYLRSAMHQPIRWHEWGEEAFAAARRENKPILLDIGAVWCHWCHVMDRESYDSPEVAEIIGRHFVAIKVDRDERPDIDARYQAAVSAISGQGGWPLTAFLTPEGKPFYGGTYFPPDDHWGRPGFKRVLQAIAQAFQEKHGEVVQSADSVMTALAQAETFSGRAADFSPRVIDKILSTAARMFDPQHGGFGNAPKFPHPAVMELALDRYAATQGPELKNLIVSTLEKMARGGVYDQLAGGFHRYSVDERWVVPHFEKMSYDNSELLKNYAHAYQATGDTFFHEVARGIIGWMDEVLSDRAQGGFFASQDADISLDDDGDYFTWTSQEARSVLSEDEAAVATLHYDIGEIGEMHHNPAKNVLYQRASLEEISTRNGMPLDRVRALLDSAKRKMLAARRLRPTPYIDKTVYVSWNALCISAYLAAARPLKLEDARHFALRSLDRLLAEGWDAERGLRHVIAYSDPAAAARPTTGLLDDYAYLSLACLDAYEATADLSYFSFARRIADAMIERFYDAAAGGFFDAPQPAAGDGSPLGALAARRKPFQDSPTPAGNPSAAIALLRLFSYTNHAPYRDQAEQTLKVFAGLAEQFGIFAGSYGIAAVWLSQPHTQVVVVGEGEAAARLEEVALAPFALTKAVLRLAPNQAIALNLPPALAESIPNLPGLKEGEKEGRAVAIVCSGFTCQPPVSDPQELERLLQQHLSSKSG
jgi:uncharacterized protein YyaL (SSP411 family)